MSARRIETAVLLVGRIEMSAGRREIRWLALADRVDVDPGVPGGSRYPVTAMRKPSLVWISVATPTSLPSLSFIDAPADSGSCSAGMLAHP
jgi:hypothetical protein